MAFNFNGNTPKKILYNGLNVAKLVYNGVVVWSSSEQVLPDGYTQVEYLESTGTQYIDTGFKPTGDTKIKIKVQLPTQSTTQQGIFGSRPGNTEGKFTIFTGGRVDALQVDYNTVNNLANYASPISNFNATNVNEIEMSNKLVINETLVREVSKASFQSSVNLYLFANNNLGTPQLKMNGKIWYCKIYDNNVLVRDLIPCINSSNVAGMYDLVNAEFYTNAGTGSFIAGEVETVNYALRNVDDNDRGIDTLVEESIALPTVANQTVTADIDTEIAPNYAEINYTNSEENEIQEGNETQEEVEPVEEIPEETSSAEEIQEENGENSDDVVPYEMVDEEHKTLSDEPLF